MPHVGEMLLHRVVSAGITENNLREMRQIIMFSRGMYIKIRRGNFILSVLVRYCYCFSTSSNVGYQVLINKQLNAKHLQMT